MSHAQASLFRQTHDRFKKELLEKVVPFWEKHGIDRAHGGYHHFLDRQGRVYDPEKSMWIQWRSVYTFATLHDRIGGKTRWLEHAVHGYDFLVKHGKDPRGNYYFSLNGKGEPLTAPHSIYTECFAAMGAAALFKVTGESKYRREAESATRKYLGRMEDPKGKWDKGERGKAERLSLGHYMILANLGYVMDECLGTTRYAAEVAKAVDMVTRRFWDPKRKVLFENINPDFTLDLSSSEGRHIAPGHGLESMWFAMQFAEKTGNRDLAARCCTITGHLLDFGWDRKHGGLFYFMDVLGKPHLELTHDMKLWWVHNEGALAALYAYSQSGEKRFLDWFRKVDAWSWEHFRDPRYGEWYAYLDRRGEPTSTLKGSRWKCFFHLPRYLLTGMELLETLEKKALSVGSK